MHYFKLLDGNSFVGIASQMNFLVFQKKHRILLLSDVEHGQYVSVNDILYRDNWMTPVSDASVEYKTVSVISISEEEYNTLNESIESGKEIVIEPEIEVPPPEEVYVNPNDEVTIDFVRDKKLAVLSKQCQSAIVGGVDVELSIGNVKHFSLSVEDQLNIASMITMMQQGVQAVPYHADGELCSYFSPEDMQKIATAATNWKTYHITYFNSLRNYVNSLDDINDIMSIQYGVMPPAEFCSDVLLEMINNA